MKPDYVFQKLFLGNTVRFLDAPKDAFCSFMTDGDDTNAKKGLLHMCSRPTSHVIQSFYSVELEKRFIVVISSGLCRHLEAGSRCILDFQLLRPCRSGVSDAAQSEE